MAFSPDLKTRLTTALAEPAAAAEMEAAITDYVSQTITNGVTTSAPSENAVYDALALKLTATQAANVAALAGTLTGSATGTIVDVAAAAAACGGGATPDADDVDAAVATAVAALVTSTNLALKELQTKLNAEIAALKSASVQASS